MHLLSTNPSTGERLAEYPQDSDAELDRKLRQGATATAEWAGSTFAERAAGLHAIARHLRQRQADLARTMALEMGKPITQGEAEIAKCAWTCDFFADHAESFLVDEDVATDARRSYVCFPPLGMVLAVMPWNFPFWQVIRCAAPALMAGNTVALKHASNVTGCALALADLIRSAGLPEGCFTVLLADSRRLVPVIRHPAIQAVALTGSVSAGQQVAAVAGGCLKKVVLELGGSDPYLVLADADLALAARVGAQARLINGGQSCIAAKRFLVAEGVHAEFTEALVSELSRARVGDPLDHHTEVGPLARTDLREELHRQVAGSIAAGARVRLGAAIPAGPGAYYPPTLLDEVAPGMPVFDEETFGPVAAVTRFGDQAEGIALANASRFGLGAAVFTRNAEAGLAIATRELAAGACFVNAAVRSDPRLPFGGIKDSGYGRELGTYGIREFVNLKSVYLG